MNADGKRNYVWGAQAASLSFSAAGRKCPKRLIRRDVVTQAIAGRLSATAGWQPALPGISCFAIRISSF